ncbi:MAG: hypothetical protein J6A22_02795 [Bacteroidales bacterium]|nr:hypothetical protein [Bacteroidales bacterium]
MKFNFTKFSKLLLCGVAVAMVGCTDLEEDIRVLDEKVDSLTQSTADDLKASEEALKQEIASAYETKDAVANLKKELEGKIGTEIDKLSGEIDDLLANKASKEDLQKAVNDAQAAIAEVLKGYATVEQVNGYVTSIEGQFKTLKDAVDGKLNTTDFEAYKTQVTTELTKLEGSVTSLKSYVDQQDQILFSQLQEVLGTVMSIGYQFQGQIGEFEDLVAPEGVQEKTLVTVLNAATASAAAANSGLAAHIEAYEAYVEVLEERLATNEQGFTQLSNLVNTLEGEIETLKQNEANLAEMINEQVNLLAQLIQGHADAIDELTQYTQGINERLTQVEASVGNLFNYISDVELAFQNRIQSLVYVPDYNDGKATLDWALIGKNAASFAILPKASVLKYRVYANPGVEAAVAAQEVATAWADENGIVDFEVEPVAVRTKAEAEADLEILNVEAKEDYLVVTVLPKNFAPEFFLGGQQIATNAGVQSTDISYSAAILLNDGSNNRSSEYTNFVAGTAAEFEAALYLPYDAVENENPAALANNKVITKEIACNDTETVQSTVAPILGFTIDNDEIMSALPAQQPYLTLEQMAQLGYDVEAEQKAIIGGFYTDYIGQGTEHLDLGKMFIIDEDPDFTYNVRIHEGVDFSNVGKKMTFEYQYTVGTVVLTLTYDVVLSNAKLTANVGTEYEDGVYTEIKWTAALAEELSDAANYDQDLVIEAIPYSGIGDMPIKDLLENKAPLKDWKKAVYVKNAAGEWVENADLTSKFIVSDFGTKAGEIAEFTILAGAYAWNNEYKVVYTSTNPVQHVDLTTNMIFKLTMLPTEFPVNINAGEFKMTASGTFEAPVNVIDAAFKVFTEGEYNYLGVTVAADAVKAWEAHTSDWVANYEAGDAPSVNGKTGVLNNIIGLVNARIYQSQLAEGENTITATLTDKWGIKYNVKITGTLQDLTKLYALIPSTDYVKDGKVHVNGRIDGAGNAYLIDDSFLDKYFAVTGDIQKDHKLTVDFVAANGTPLNATADVVAKDDVATYNSIAQTQFSWGTFEGLEIPLKATLKVNGYALNTVEVVLYTVDPILEFKNSGNVVAQRAPGYPTTVHVLDNVTIKYATGYNSANVLQTAVANFKNGTNVANFKAAFGDVVVELDYDTPVYYMEGDKKINIARSKYSFDNTTNKLTLVADDGSLNVDYFADVVVSFEHKYHAGEVHKVNVTVQFKASAK